MTIVKFFNHHQGSVGNRFRPGIQVSQDGTEYLLRLRDLLQIAEGVGKVFHQPFPALHCLGEVEAMEDGKFLFVLNNG